MNKATTRTRSNPSTRRSQARPKSGRDKPLHGSTGQGDATPLDSRQLRHLRSLAHALKPVVRLGQHGLSDAVKHELDIALTRHELVKVKLAAADRDSRKAQLDALSASVGSIVVQQIGHTATLYRRSTERARIDLSANGRGA